VEGVSAVGRSAFSSFLTIFLNRIEGTPLTRNDLGRRSSVTARKRFPRSQVRGMHTASINLKGTNAPRPWLAIKALVAISFTSFVIVNIYNEGNIGLAAWSSQVSSSKSNST
jgi:hypothetical protein